MTDDRHHAPVWLTPLALEPGTRVEGDSETVLTIVQAATISALLDVGMDQARAELIAETAVSRCLAAMLTRDFVVRDMNHELAQLVAEDQAEQ